MCDCYDENCSEKGCQELLPVHLGDYETNREEIKVYCENHIPINDCRIFIIKEEDEGFPKGWKMGIRSLTDNAREFKDYNHPNVGADYTVEDI